MAIKIEFIGVSNVQILAISIKLFYWPPKCLHVKLIYIIT